MLKSKELLYTLIKAIEEHERAGGTGENVSNYKPIISAAMQSATIDAETYEQTSVFLRAAYSSLNLRYKTMQDAEEHKKRTAAEV